MVVDEFLLQSTIKELVREGYTDDQIMEELDIDKTTYLTFRDKT